MDDAKIKGLLETVFEARKKSYSPYSGYSVGAGLISGSGKIYTGGNIENASYPICICAEQTVFSAAISEGEKSFSAIAVVGGKEDAEGRAVSGYCFPCGKCRQLMAEFCEDDFLVITAKNIDDYKVMTLGELLPEAFRL